MLVDLWASQGEASGQGSERRLPQDRRLSAHQAFEAERAILLALPRRDRALYVIIAAFSDCGPQFPRP